MQAVAPAKAILTLAARAVLDFSRESSSGMPIDKRVRSAAEALADVAAGNDKHWNGLSERGRVMIKEANRLGIVVTELSAEQKKGLNLASGLVVTDVRPDSKADVRKGDILMTLVHKGQHTELKSVEQFNKLLAGLDKNAIITLQVRRGEATAFVTISGLTDKG